MNPQFNTAAIKCLEAAKLIKAVKDPTLRERADNCARILWQVSAELLMKLPKGPDPEK